MNKLPLPLHCYDHAGRVIPPNLFWFSGFFLMKSWLIFLGSITIRGKEKEILEFWFPVHQDLYVSLILGLPALLAMVLASYRNTLWDKGKTRWVYWIGILMSLAVITQLIYSMNRLVQAQFNYHNSLALSIFGISLIGVYMLRSQHIELMLKDWLR